MTRRTRKNPIDRAFVVTYIQQGEGPLLAGGGPGSYDSPGEVFVVKAMSEGEAVKLTGGTGKGGRDMVDVEPVKAGNNVYAITKVHSESDFSKWDWEKEGYVPDKARKPTHRTWHWGYAQGKTANEALRSNHLKTETFDEGGNTLKITYRARKVNPSRPARKNAKKGARASVVRFMEQGGEQERAISRGEPTIHDLIERIEEMPRSPKSVREFEKPKKTRKGKRRYVRNNPIEYLRADEYMKGLDAGLFEEGDPRIRILQKKKSQGTPKEAYWDGFEDAKRAWHKGQHSYSDIARWMLKNAKSGYLLEERSSYGDEYRRGAEEYFDARQDAESRRSGHESSDYWERGLNNPSGRRGTGPRGGYTAAERAALPASDFLVPSRRKWPVSNKKHANIALQYMTRWKGLDAAKLIRKLAKDWPVDENPDLWKRYSRLKPKIEKQCGCKVPSLSELKGGRRNPKRAKRGGLSAHQIFDKYLNGKYSRRWRTGGDDSTLDFASFLKGARIEHDSDFPGKADDGYRGWKAAGYPEGSDARDAGIEWRGADPSKRRNPGNPEAAEAMRLHHEEGMSLKEAWRRVRGGARKNGRTRALRRHHWYY